MLHIRGYAGGGYCFMIDDKAVSVHEALLSNGRPFHKSTINALNRKNLANENDLVMFERQAEILHTGLDALSACSLLLQKFDIDVLNTCYMELSSSQVGELVEVYKISKYKVPSYTLTHSPMYYFYRYLSDKMKASKKSKK